MQFIPKVGEEKVHKLLSLGNKPFCLHSFISQARDIEADLGAVVDFFQLPGNRALGETSIWGRKLPFYSFFLFFLF